LAYNNDWQEDAVCAKPSMEPYRDIFFSEDPEDIQDAKLVCGNCPVRLKCLSSALDSKEIWGVWGGLDENEIRIVLSVDEDGQEVRRIRKGEAPICPNCKADTGKLHTKELDFPGGGRWTTKKVVTCEDCDFSWTSRTSANAVESYRALKSRTSSAE
jgi:hypothetical protein